MKNLIATCLMLMMVLPAFLQWLPHGSLHALHEYHTAHHAQDGHDHGYEGHNHQADLEQSIHHGIHFDVVTYFSDYLHVDLQTPDKLVLKNPTQDLYDFSFILPAHIEPQHRHGLASAQSRAPPDWHRPLSGKTPLYLSTKRLRI